MVDKRGRVKPDHSMEIAMLMSELKRRKEKVPEFAVPQGHFKTFQKTYAGNPLAFVHDCIDFRGDTPTPYQDEVLANLIPKRRVAMYGPRGVGKTSLMSWLIHWAILTVDDVKVPTTASAWQQLINYLWPEVRKWAGRIRWDIVGREPYRAKDEMKSEELSLNGDQAIAFAVASTDANRIEGAHSTRRVLAVFDESKAIQDATFDSMEGAFTLCEEPLAIAVSTPGPPIGRFFEICSNRDGKFSDWWVRHVTMQEQIACGRMSAEWAEKRRVQWGADSSMYKCQVLGEFAGDTEGTVIPWHLIERACERWKAIGGNFGPITAIGVDVGGGGDPSMAALASGRVIVDLRQADYVDTMETTGWVTGLMRAHPMAHVYIDVIGLGSGVFYRLKEIPGFATRVHPVNSANKTDTLDEAGELGFVNVRAEMWWRVREELQREDCLIALPDDDYLKGELAAPMHKTRSEGAILIESKDEIRKRLGRSTDKADSVLMALLGKQVGMVNDVQIGRLNFSFGR